MMNDVIELRTRDRLKRSTAISFNFVEMFFDMRFFPH